MDIEIYKLFLPEKGVKWHNSGIKTAVVNRGCSSASNETFKV